MKIAAAAAAAGILITLIRAQSREMALALSLVTLVALALGAAGMVKEAAVYLRGLGDAAGFAPSVLAPLFKVAAVSVLTQVAVTFCTDAGEGAVAKLVELCGSVAALCAMLPLLSAVVDLTRDMMGG